MRMTLEQQIALERLSHALFQANYMVSWQSLRLHLFTEQISQVQEKTLRVREPALYDALRERREFTKDDLPHVDSFLAPLGPFETQLIKPEAYKILGLRCMELDIQEMHERMKGS